MRKKTEKRGSQNQETLIKSKRTCQFTAANVEEIDYKDVELLSKFINEMGKFLLQE